MLHILNSAKQLVKWLVGSQDLGYTVKRWKLQPVITW